MDRKLDQSKFLSLAQGWSIAFVLQLLVSHMDTYVIGDFELVGGRRKNKFGKNLLSSYCSTF